MTPDAEKSMRAQLADYGKGEMIDLAISLQEVIDDHVSEKRAMQNSIDAMSQQLPALRAELEKHEGSVQSNPEEIEAKNQQIAMLKQHSKDLQEKCDKLQALNEKYQEKLLDSL
ncbi:MAG: hypothetical protein OES26_09945 [Gammaproteobacteria bacterium]|nr:hypothetical protein [Gammaproteobacteria bacterium]